MKIIAQNKKAFYEYDILERLEAGIVLTGNEVKSVRAGQVSLIGSFAAPHKAELFLINAMISPYSHAYSKGEEEGRKSRKLLLHKRELTRLFGDISRKGITVVPLKLYINQKGMVKVELGVAKHKKAHGIKEAIKERDIERETRRELTGKYKY
ncbi:SsrA-binding protein SmpB [Candidatus Dependentiae bacterium]|nr:SsrA-binding protein SmpB [Candidatus Dependentiae bacterium]